VKFGAGEKRKVVVMVVLLGIAILVAIRAMSGLGWLSASKSSVASAKPVQTADSSRSTQKKNGAAQDRENTLDPTLRTDYLAAAQKVEYAGGKRNIFRMEAPPPPPTPIPTPIVSVRPEPTGPPPPPPPPPINLKFFGFANRPGEPKKVFLSEGDEIFVAKEGDIIDRRYKIVQIANTSVLVEDVLNNNRQPIPLTTAP
jgi:hypothetical protein